MTQIRRITIATALFICALSLFSQSREVVEADPLSQEISLQRGVTGSFRSSSESVFTGYNTNIEYARFDDPHWGFRTGLSFTDSYPGCAMQYTVPFRLAYRTYTHQTREGYIELNSFEDFFISILQLFPYHLEFNGGISLGYAQAEKQVYDLVNHPNYYKVNNNVVLTLDLGMRYNLHFGPLNLFIAPQFSYQPTRNYVYYSQNGSRKEYERAFFGGISGGVGFRY